ncbi:hypothetical protein AC579_9101, partial [Pseudocercospora musae]
KHWLAHFFHSSTPLLFHPSTIINIILLISLCTIVRHPLSTSPTRIANVICANALYQRSPSTSYIDLLYRQSIIIRLLFLCQPSQGQDYLLVLHSQYFSSGIIQQASARAGAAQTAGSGILYKKGIPPWPTSADIPPLASHKTRCRQQAPPSIPTQYTFIAWSGYERSGAMYKSRCMADFISPELRRLALWTVISTDSRRCSRPLRLHDTTMIGLGWPLIGRSQTMMASRR